MCAGVSAQINPYARITDRRALARLSGPDALPLRYVNRFGYPPDRDPIDSNFILAQDNGAGIISHLWATTTARDSTTSFKLYIDDKLIVSSNFPSFFRTEHGALRPPFDSLYPGAFVSDVQIPYKKNFKITYIGEGWNVYYAIAWRPVQDSNQVTSFQLTPSPTVESYQRQAESVYWGGITPWQYESVIKANDSAQFFPGTTRTVFHSKGNGMIEKIKFSSDTHDYDTIDSLWLNIYWDGSPYPAVHVPLANFFCASNGGTNVSAYSLRVDSSGLTSYFPMPFGHEAKIDVVSTLDHPIQLRTQIAYTKEKIDKNEYGYFHAHFAETNPTRYHIYHPVLHDVGRGKFVGLYHYAPHNWEGVVLEGDPRVYIDSNPRNNFRYTGGEDYYNSGWWFLGQLFSKPFAGNLNFFKGFYRFHVLDAVDFLKSIDFDLQPGANTDLMVDFRTIAYYYKQPCSFWVSRDTIRSGQRWVVTGVGYTPHTPIVATLDSTETIFTTSANDSGVFSAVLIVPPSIITGARTLSINNEKRAEPIYILSAPAIRPMVDTLPVTLRCNDTVRVTGTGFDIGEKINIYLDSILLSDSATTAGVDYRFETIVRMPNIANWKYHLRAVGIHHNEAIANDLVSLTRIRPYEFEDLINTATPDSGNFYRKQLSPDWGRKWSQQAVAIFEPKTTKEKLRFKFYLPVSDTFNVTLMMSVGMRFGNYSYAIDGKNYGTFHGFLYDSTSQDNLIPGDTQRLGSIYFAKDTHTIVFTCVGKDSGALDFRLAADVLLLTPTTVMPLPKGVFILPSDHQSGILDSPKVLERMIRIYPNPADKEITIGIDFIPGIVDGLIGVELTDILGHTVRWRHNVPLNQNGFSEKFNLEGLPAGNYVATLSIESGGTRAIVHSLIQVRE